jgi:hypothetical protein
MKLSIRGLAIATGLLWGGALLCVGLAHLASPSYASSFLEGISSIYPGFHGVRSLTDALVGTGYGLVDGAAGGFVFGWLYNHFAVVPTGQQRN